MNEEYKQIECISKMKKEYFDKFCTIVEGYREKISDNLVKRIVYYEFSSTFS